MASRRCGSGAGGHLYSGEVQAPPRGGGSGRQHKRKASAAADEASSGTTGHVLGGRGSHSGYEVATAAARGVARSSPGGTQVRVPSSCWYAGADENL